MRGREGIGTSYLPWGTTLLSGREGEVRDEERSRRERDDDDESKWGERNRKKIKDNR